MVVHEAVPVRQPIAESWRRSRDAGVDAGVAAAPLVFDRDVLADARAAHPLERHLPMLEALLRQVADETEHLMVITDETGNALWTQGPPAVSRAADAIGLTEGFRWSEDAVGTNGIGTALATGRPEYVYAAEHVAHVLHGWSCAGAPVTDPDTGRIVGCIDVSATVDALHPATVALVAAAARLAESRLENEMLARDERLRERLLPHLRGLRGAGALVTPTGRIIAGERLRGRRVPVPEPGGTVVLPDGRTAVAEPLGEAFLLRLPGLVGRVDTGARAGRDAAAPPAGDAPLLTLTLLGAGQPHAHLDGRRFDLTLRHAEILALLALHPRGLSGDRLALYLYGDDGSPATVRPEIHRLRQQFGGIVRARPYRLGCAVEADFLTVRRLLDGGDVAAAARLYGGELLPLSDAPGVRAERDELAVRVRRQVVDRGGAEALWTYVQTEPGRADLEALERLRAVLPPGDPRLPAVSSRRARLLGGEP
ncbi:MULTISPECIES: helix-turn-helix domain-containing protein [Actinomadura]|uniref:GAF domain-containing protein n=1 Tax=Actinomadura madurae TaxID=1993 RepID=A0A1I5APA3_9ACTN|nr:helix-turn-helix domain-containing protein [Actinomadura madurae]SFN64257.1 GAF domain-containing protein [Actinomadura madurae]SPT57159.1 Acetoin catabolism regulatory protein [Actinomadura madurae]